MTPPKFLKESALIAANLKTPVSYDDKSSFEDVSGNQLQPKFWHQGLEKLKNTDLKFVNDKGESVNLLELSNKISGQNSTITFMFGSCTTYCPKNMTILNAVSEKDPHVKHIIISSNPANDYRSMLNDHLDRAGVTKENRIILYPSLTGSPKDFTEPKMAMDKLMGELQKKVEIAEAALNLLPTGKDFTGHSPVVKLYRRNGQHVLDSLDPKSSEMIKELTESLPPAPTPAFRPKAIKGGR